MNFLLKYLTNDFFPFTNLNKIKCAMTAHIKYNFLDNINCATHQKVIINKL